MLIKREWCVCLEWREKHTSALISARPSRIILQILQLLLYAHFLIGVADTTRYVYVQIKGIVNTIKSANLVSIKICLYAYICLKTHFSCSRKQCFVYIE